MTRRLRVRFWLEVGGLLATAFVLVLTVVVNDWLETVGIDPDHGNGTVEWTIVVASLLATAMFASYAWVEWRRAAAAPA